jgi:hypothetical protein
MSKVSIKHVPLKHDERFVRISFSLRSHKSEPDASDILLRSPNFRLDRDFSLRQFRAVPETVEQRSEICNRAADFTARFRRLRFFQEPGCRRLRINF